jgi:CheY-like chemotaxis protein
MRVLIVDDYENAAVACCKLLELLGHECRCAFSGEAALSLLLSFTPDVIVLDLDMPGTTGYEVARAVRAGSLGAKVFLAALTGTTAADHRTSAAGFDLHVMKPASAAKLAAITDAAAAAKRRAIA